MTFANRHFVPRICVLCGDPYKPFDSRSERCDACKSTVCAVCRVPLPKLRLHRIVKNSMRMCMSCYSQARTRPEGSTKVHEDSGYIYEKCGDHWMLQHRLVVERSIGRKLASDEHVHHRNDDKGDNRIENLEVLGLREHMEGRHMDRLYAPPRHRNGRRKKSDPTWRADRMDSPRHLVEVMCPHGAAARVQG